MISLRLKAKVGRRVERGHLWIFSNEVESISELPEAGGEVAVFSAKGRFIGMGLYSPSSLIRARIYSRAKDEPCDPEFIKKRLRQAREYRRAIGALGHSYRLVHSEADGLPGAIVDVFGDQVVLQISTLGMEVRRRWLVEAIAEILQPASLIERSETAARELEGLKPVSRVLQGTPADPARVEENGVVLFADLAGGQKTGYYLDQVRNRSLAIPFFHGRRVLDLFCYVGSWSVVAAVHGAASVLGVDSSERALELARRAAAANEAAREKCQFIRQDVFSFLRSETARKQKYGVVVVDPPPLAKSRKDLANALRAYRELNLRALQALDEDGVLITCSCSHHVSMSDLRETLIMAAKDSHTDFSIIHEAAQSPDHPVHLQTPETGYLKAIFLRRRDWQRAGRN